VRQVLYERKAGREPTFCKLECVLLVFPASMSCVINKFVGAIEEETHILNQRKVLHKPIQLMGQLNCSFMHTALMSVMNRTF
jgi:hypothetical protein